MINTLILLADPLENQAARDVAIAAASALAVGGGAAAISSSRESLRRNAHRALTAYSNISILFTLIAVATCLTGMIFIITGDPSTADGIFTVLGGGGVFAVTKLVDKNQRESRTFSLEVDSRDVASQVVSAQERLIAGALDRFSSAEEKDKALQMIIERATGTLHEVASRDVRNRGQENLALARSQTQTENSEGQSPELPAQSGPAELEAGSTSHNSDPTTQEASE